MKRILVLLPFLLAGAEPSFRFERPIQARQGWAVLGLPDDVLDACRPGLPDLRVLDPARSEIPFALDRGDATASRRLEPRDVEKVPSQQTTALFDRGEGPRWADRAELELEGNEFLKPAVLEASSDRASWAEVARGSVFRTGDTESLSLRFPPNDRRWWRLRLDDRNGPAVSLSGLIEWQSPNPATLREIQLALRAEPDADSEWVSYAARLPAANLSVTAIRVAATDPAFARQVRVFERVALRDELGRIELGEGEIFRSGQVQTSVSIRSPSSRLLEIEIAKAGGVALHVTELRAVVEEQRLLFYASDRAPVVLAYGSASAEPKRYDLDAAFGHGRPQAPARATLGPAKEVGASRPPLPRPVRGVVLDPSAWRTQRELVPPAMGSIAFADLDLPSAEWPSIRILDRVGQQVPYLWEAEPRTRTTALGTEVRASGTKTLVRVSGLKRWHSVRVLELGASAPAYFERQVVVREVGTDQRGAAARRQIGSGVWKKAMEDPFKPLRIPVDAPAYDTAEFEIENGDNAPLTLTTAAAVWEVRRLDFVFDPGEKLMLWSGNPQASAPRYDLGLVKERVLSAPAEAATLGPERAREAPAANVPRVFWVFVVVAGLLVLGALVRTLPKPSKRATS
jgi:hypothetical protein